MFDVSKVVSVYSGRKGCACGCRGKYTHSSAHQLPANHVVNDAVVRQTVKKIEYALREGIAAFVMVDPDGDWVAVDMPHDRTYTLYFCTEVEVDEVEDRLGFGIKE